MMHFFRIKIEKQRLENFLVHMVDFQQNYNKQKIKVEEKPKGFGAYH